MIRKILRFFGLAPSEQDLKLKKQLESGWKTLRVSGRGAVHVDIEEVKASPQYKEALKKAEEIVKKSNKKG